LFGNNYRSHGISGPIQVFDTPGFGNADPNSIYKKKLLLSNLVKNRIDVVILLTANRFDEENQRKF